MVKATDCKPVFYEFESHSCLFTRVVEEFGLSRLIWDEEHVGSNPTYPTVMEVLSNWLARLTVNQVFSNPASQSNCPVV